MCARALPPIVCSAAPRSTTGHCRDPTPTLPRTRGFRQALLDWHYLQPSTTSRLPILCRPCLPRAGPMATTAVSTACRAPCRARPPLLSPEGACAYIPPHRTSCPPMSPPSSFTGKAVRRSPVFSPSRPPWTGCLTASCLPFLGPTEAPQCGLARGLAGDTFLSPECRRIGAAPPPSPALGEILPHLLFRLELVLRCLPHPPLTVQDLSELQFTLAGRRNRCATPSMLVSRTPLPHLLVGHFVSSKRGPALAQ
jgi:hypothetical protein